MCRSRGTLHLSRLLLFRSTKHPIGYQLHCLRCYKTPDLLLHILHSGRMRSSHRKSHSTSVLSFLAGSPASTSQLSLEQNAPRQQHRSKRGQSVLPSVDEQLSNTSNNILSGLQGMMDDRQKDDHPGDRLKRGRGRGDAKQLLSDVSTFYLISSQ